MRSRFSRPGVVMFTLVKILAASAYFLAFIAVSASVRSFRPRRQSLSPWQPLPRRRSSLPLMRKACTPGRVLALRGFRKSQRRHHLVLRANFQQPLFNSLLLGRHCGTGKFRERTSAPLAVYASLHSLALYLRRRSLLRR